MKRKGCTAYLVEDRNEELLSVYNKLMKTYRCAPCDVYDLLEFAPSSRFWVTGERAYEFLSKKHRRESDFYKLRLAMYDEIERRARQWMDEHESSFRTACKAVVLQKAPCFYLTRRTMENIIRHKLHTRHKKI